MRIYRSGYQSKARRFDKMAVSTRHLIWIVPLLAVVHANCGTLHCSDFETCATYPNGTEFCGKACGDGSYVCKSQYRCCPDSCCKETQNCCGLKHCCPSGYNCCTDMGEYCCLSGHTCNAGTCSPLSLDTLTGKHDDGDTPFADNDVFGDTILKENPVDKDTTLNDTIDGDDKSGDWNSLFGKHDDDDTAFTDNDVDGDTPFRDNPDYEDTTSGSGSHWHYVGGVGGGAFFFIIIPVCWVRRRRRVALVRRTMVRVPQQPGQRVVVVRNANRTASATASNETVNQPLPNPVGIIRDSTNVVSDPSVNHMQPALPVEPPPYTEFVDDSDKNRLCDPKEVQDV